jgi:hypothetical protein
MNLKFCMNIVHCIIMYLFIFLNHNVSIHVLFEKMYFWEGGSTLYVLTTNQVHREGTSSRLATRPPSALRLREWASRHAVAAATTRRARSRCSLFGSATQARCFASPVGFPAQLVKRLSAARPWSCWFEQRRPRPRPHPRTPRCSSPAAPASSVAAAVPVPATPGSLRSAQQLPRRRSPLSRYVFASSVVQNDFAYHWSVLLLPDWLPCPPRVCGYAELALAATQCHPGRLAI